MDGISSSLQNHILSRLKNATMLRYSELMPTVKVSSDLFNYHLQFLVKKGLVDKTDDGYSLSDSGLKYIADPFSAQEYDSKNSFFKLNVIAVVSRVKDGKVEILNQIRKSQPSFGKVGAIGGVVRKGESVEDAAQRKLVVEAGLVADFRVVGYERRLLYKSGELFSDVIFPIAYADNAIGELMPETEFGQNMWVSIDEAIKNDSAEFDSVPSIVKILKALKSGYLDKLPMFFETSIQKGE